MPDDQMPMPTSQPWFTRMLGVFGLTRHPKSMDDNEGGPSDPVTSTSEIWNRMFALAQDRRQRYQIYDEMDTFGMVQAVLDLYSEETTQPDYDKGRSVWIESPDGKVVEAGHECFTNCRIEDVIPAVVRETSKYGDAIRRLIYQSGKGVLAWKHVEPHKAHRLVDKYSRLIGFREDGQKFRGKQRSTSWPWDYVHFRMLGRDEKSEYGSSLLEPMFRPWRQLVLSEDAMLIYRLRRAPDRNIVYVDVGDMDEHEAVNYINYWRKKFRKHEFVDPASNQYKKLYNPLTPVEDIFFPVRKDEERSRVEQFSGGSADPGNVYDIDYFRNTFFATAKVPKAYMGFEGEINAKATLMQQDVRFARTCKRVRKSAVYGLRNLCDIHYTLRGFDMEKIKYIVQMSPISFLDEFERLELIQLRYQIVDAMSQLAQTMQIDPKVWATYILTDFAKLPDEMVTKLVKNVGKAPVAPGGEGGFPEGVTPAQRFKILNEHGEDMLRMVTEPMGTEGYTQLTEEEQKAIASCIHKSPALRKVVGDISEYYQDDFDGILIGQTDPSILPPASEGVSIQDDYADDKAAKELKEDIENLKNKKPVTEGVETEKIKTPDPFEQQKVE